MPNSDLFEGNCKEKPFIEISSFLVRGHNYRGSHAYVHKFPLHSGQQLVAITGI
jgi:hypothetical protein